MVQQPFYAEGLRFSCARCSACCRYESGYVFLSEKDLDLLAAVQNMGKAELIKTYCRWVAFGGGIEYLSLKEKTGYDCIFWQEGCTVYDGRPLQCRNFPFWDSIMVSAEAWNMAKSGCPGMGKGVLHSMAQIEACLEERLAEPVLTRSGKTEV
ncbi:zinc/iron-chelating domain-containing protein [Spirochaetia bacterium]|nr:zinc/iron-chelating domain-containing protein [Spirochaetia bacterium]